MTIIMIMLICCGFFVFFRGLPAVVGIFDSSLCGQRRPAGITVGDLVGRYSDGNAGRMELRADGTLTSSGLISDGQRLSGPGTWRLLPPGGNDDIKATFATADEPSASYGMPLELSGTRHSPVIWWYHGDPDSCQLYQLYRSGPAGMPSPAR